MEWPHLEGASDRQRSHRAIVLLGAVYFVTGIALGALAGRAASSEMRVTWRLLAWVVSGAAFLAHIGYEHIRLHSAPRAAALHASLAAALGAFGLAAAANVHALWVGSGNRRLLAIALVAWPALTGVAAFVVAFAAAAGLTRIRRRG